jgi:hypothetical protein
LLGVYLLDVHDFLRNSAVKHRTLDHVDSNLNAIDTVTTNIASGVNQLAKVYLAVLDSDETNKVRPGRHHGVWQ